ncbi:MAG: hypothetical protein CW338_00615 [Clostridiales bacterium]|nr:hypothetical protein [Clostridiales bacterium]
MNTVWSEHVQGIQTLYLSRKLRFDDRFFEQYDRIFRLDRHAKMKILEIGCGPGALAEALRGWYPEAEITAVDRDAGFLVFAKEHIPGVTFTEGDVTALPFEDGTFDAVISNTVQEHVEPGAFWGEQKRVLKPGGVCLCLSGRRGISCTAPCLERTEKEAAYWNRCPDWKEELEQYNVCRYPMTEAGIPQSMAEHGFVNVTTGYAVIDLTPDDPKYPPETAEMMFEAMRQNDIEAARRYFSGQELQEVLSLVNARFDERARLYRCGMKQWDTTVSVTMILRGTA